ncbi:MAG: GNAT family N-acetyltransferase [Cyanobacteriota bacterium]
MTNSQPAPSPRIRPFKPVDWPEVWAFLEPVLRAGETFPHDPAIPEEAARVEQSLAVMVAENAGGALVGTYSLRPNSLALGDHVAKGARSRAAWCTSPGPT